MLAELLPKVAAETQEERGKYRPRPSLAGPERCVRQLVYKSIGESAAPFPGRAILTMDDSSWHEELTADWINKTAYRLHSQQMVVGIPNAFPWLKNTKYKCSQCGSTVPGEVMHGHIDGIITDMLAKDRLFEHKAINHFSFERLWKGVWPLDYITQCVIYLRALSEVVQGVDECLLLVKNKNTAQYIEILLRYDFDKDEVAIVEVVRSDGERQQSDFTMGFVWRDTVTKFSDVEVYTRVWQQSPDEKKSRALPPRPYEVGTDFPCGYCEYAKKCWAGYEAEFDALESDTELDEDIETLCGYYLETSMHEGEMRKEKEKLRSEIYRLLQLNNARGGKAGPYVVTLSLSKYRSWDESKIPHEVAAIARKETLSTRLTIRKPKPKEAKS